MDAISAEDETVRGLRELLRSLGVSETSAQRLGVRDNLFDEGLLNSMSVVGLILKMEERFKVRIPVRELEFANIGTLEALSRLIARCRGAG